MKKELVLFITIFLLGCFSLQTKAQPRAIGVRVGTSFEALYQHFFTENSYLEVNLGRDFISSNGYEASASYNFMLLHPQITERGLWTVYTGPGFSMGKVYNNFGDKKDGFMASVFLQIGLEYRPVRALAITADIRPHYGYHSASKSHRYNGGLYGFIPALGIHLLF